MWPPLASRQRKGGSSGLRLRGTGRPRGRAGGRPGRAAAGATRRGPSQPRARRAAPRSGPGPCVTATSVDVVERRLAPLQRLGEHRGRELEMPTRSDLGNDAPVARVQLGLGRDDAGAHLAVMRVRGRRQSRRTTSRGRGSPGLLGRVAADRVLPHDQRVLAVVRVVAAAHAARLEAEAPRRARWPPCWRREPRACSRDARRPPSARRAPRAAGWRSSSAAGRRRRPRS